MDEVMSERMSDDDDAGDRKGERVGGGGGPAPMEDVGGDEAATVEEEGWDVVERPRKTARTGAGADAPTSTPTVVDDGWGDEDSLAAAPATTTKAPPNGQTESWKPSRTPSIARSRRPRPGAQS